MGEAEQAATEGACGVSHTKPRPIRSASCKPARQAVRVGRSILSELSTCGSGLWVRVTELSTCGSGFWVHSATSSELK